MNIPVGISLDTFIEDLIDADRLYVFYKTQEWITLRNAVMAEHHNECEACMAQGIYSRAETVHHEYEVKIYPKLALTRYLEDSNGTKREVLHPLCNNCHNEAHNRFLKSKNIFHLRDEIW